MTHEEVQDWLDRYIRAWRSGDREQIEALFSQDAVYRYNPHDESRWVRGRGAIANAWLNERDESESWEARYTAYAVDGDRAVATGASRYFATADEPEKTYHTAFVLKFDDDLRCTEFVEYG
jgi:ketosteroid isomerase-like protein